MDKRQFGVRLGTYYCGMSKKEIGFDVTFKEKCVKRISNVMEFCEFSKVG